MVAMQIERIPVIPQQNDNVIMRTSLLGPIITPVISAGANPYWLFFAKGSLLMSVSIEYTSEPVWTPGRKESC
jgi:hypothetical protein